MMKKNPTKNENDFDFFDHLEILRRKIIFTLILFLIFFVVSFIFIRPLVEYLKGPIKDLKVNLIYSRPQGKFLSYLKVAFMSAFYIIFPFVLYQVGSFIYPGLKKRERKLFIPTVIFAYVFFIGGSIFSYFLFTPFVMKFFSEFSANDGVLALWSISEYFHLLIFFIFLIGAIFQTPFILLFLIKLRILNLKNLIKARRYVIIFIFIFAAVITPPDIYTQALVGSLLYLFFELTIFIARRIERKKSKPYLVTQIESKETKYPVTPIDLKDE